MLFQQYPSCFLHKIAKTSNFFIYLYISHYQCSLIVLFYQVGKSMVEIKYDFGKVMLTRYFKKIDTTTYSW